MKKTYIILLALILILLSGCSAYNQISSDNDNKANPNSIEDSSSETVNNSSNTFQDKIDNSLPNKVISVRSVEQLINMREMLSCTNQEEFNNYLKSIEGGGANSKDDLEHFIKLVDSIEYVDLIDGNIVWISYSNGQAHDTEKEYEILYVTTQSENGDWIRFEYMLSVEDASKEIADKTDELTASSLISNPVISSDQKMTVFSETREKHVSGQGDVIKWTATVDGIYTNIVYYTASERQINTNNLISKASLSSITK